MFLIQSLFMSIILLKLSLSYPADFEGFEENEKKSIENEFLPLLNEAKEKNKNVSAIYGQFSECEGHFTRIQMDVIDQIFEWKCDHAWTHLVNISANGYRNDVRQPLNALSFQMVKDIKGNEDYNSIGPVLGGECTGAQLIVQSELKKSKGKCDTGVTELYSIKSSALVALRGNCETSCYGTIWVHYWPAKV